MTGVKQKTKVKIVKNKKKSHIRLYMNCMGEEKSWRERGKIYHGRYEKKVIIFTMGVKIYHGRKILL